MTKQAKQTGKVPVAVKLSSLKHKNTDAKLEREAGKIREDMLQMEEEGVRELIHAEDTCDQAMAAITDISANAISAGNEFSSNAMGLFRNFSTEIMGNWERFTSNYAQTCKEASKCRTAADIAEFQSKAMQRMMGGYFDESAKLYQALFDNCTKTLKPFGQCTADATNRIRKVMAA